MSRTASTSPKRWLMSSRRSRCPRFDAMTLMDGPYDPGEPPSPDGEQPSTPISTQVCACSALQSR
jgi:hypothetical protein